MKILTFATFLAIQLFCYEAALVTRLEPLTKGFHAPKSPKYDYLMQMIKPIIPHAIHDPPPPPEDANIEVVKGVLHTIHDMYNKLTDDPKRKADLLKVADEAKGLLNFANSNQGYKSNGRPHIRDADRDALMKKFANALKGPQVKAKPKAKAPFSRLGEDGFTDVDHQLLAMEIKRLALTVKQYLETRRQETQYYKRTGTDLTDPSIKAKDETDHVLAQTTLMMAKLHRAILRNHHHILMVIGNFAGNMVASAPQNKINVTKDMKNNGTLY